MQLNKKKQTLTPRAIAFCALLAAISIVMARLLCFKPTPSSRWSLDKFPLFLAGMFFGPLAGAMTGFVADSAGSLMQDGFNPLLCPPAILYGLFGGIFRHFIAKKHTSFRLAICYLVPTILGAWLYQSATLAWVYGQDAFLANFIAKLGTRGIQFAVIAPLEIMIICLLLGVKIFHRIGIWPPIKHKRGSQNDDC